MNKLLVICGPTATGKTRLALHLAQLVNGEVISADSRQVYKHMDIGTGKEGKVAGYDLVLPTKGFSVSNYIEFANNEIANIYDRDKLPILTGGTGLYIDGVVNGIETASVPPNPKLRNELSQKSADELFATLLKLNPIKANSLNNSDKKNPRRLVRAIEISKSKKKTFSKPNFDSLWVGLNCPLSDLKKRIFQRVDARVEAGFAQEIEFLKSHNLWGKVAETTLGYKDWPNIEKWKLEEFKYAKRQLTWFKKNQSINWFDITQDNWSNKVEKLVQRWYPLGENA